MLPALGGGGGGGWRGPGSRQPAVTPHDHMGAQLVHLGRPLRRRDCVPGKPARRRQFSEPPSLAARLPVSPVPGRVMCAAGNGMVLGRLACGQEPRPPLRWGGSGGGPCSRVCCCRGRGGVCLLTFLLWCLENQGVYTLEAKGPGSSLLYDVGQFSVTESFGKSTLRNCLV